MNNPEKLGTIQVKHIRRWLNRVDSLSSALLYSAMVEMVSATSDHTVRELEDMNTADFQARFLPSIEDQMDDHNEASEVGDGWEYDLDGETIHVRQPTIRDQRYMENIVGNYQRATTMLKRLIEPRIDVTEMKIGHFFHLTRLVNENSSSAGE